MIKHILAFDTKNPTKKRILVSDEDFFLVKVENNDRTESCVIDMDETSDFAIVDANNYSTTYKFTPNPAGDTYLKVRLGGSTQLQDLTITRQDLDIGHSDTASAADVAGQLEAVDEEIAEVKKEVVNAAKGAWQKGGSYVQNSGSSIGDSKGNMAVNLDTATYYANSDGKMTIDGLYLTVNPDVTFNDKVHINGGTANFDVLNALGGNVNQMESVTTNVLQVYNDFETDAQIVSQSLVKGQNLASTLDLNVGRTANMAGNCNVFGDLAVAAGKTIKIGSTSITEDQLKKLLALI